MGRQRFLALTVESVFIQAGNGGAATAVQLVSKLPIVPGKKLTRYADV